MRMLTAVNPKIPISIVALQAADLLEPWWFSRLPSERELVLFEGVVPDWLASVCLLNKIPIQAIHAGCLCCLGGPVLKIQLIRAVRQFKPLSVLIVAGTQAALPAVADALQTPLLETAFNLSSLIWVNTFALADLKQGKSALSKHQLDNWGACTACVVVNSALATVNVHIKVSELFDSVVLATWANTFRFKRQQVPQVLQSAHWPKGLVLIFRTQREWYRLGGSHVGQNLPGTTLIQSNWRLDSQLIYRDTDSFGIDVIDKLLIETITMQIKNLSFD
jgi:hypothetical protein